MAVLIGRLCREQALELPARGSAEEGREQPGDVELSMEAVREDPEKPRTLALAERAEACFVRRQVDRERRPLMPLPVCVESLVRRCLQLELARMSLTLRRWHCANAQDCSSNRASERRILSRLPAKCRVLPPLENGAAARSGLGPKTRSRTTRRIRASAADAGKHAEIARTLRSQPACS